MRFRYPHTLLTLALVAILLGQRDGYTQSETDAAAVHPQTNRDNALTEDQVIDCALQTSQKLESLGTNVDIADYRRDSSGWIDNPELRISDIGVRYYPERARQLRVGLRWRFPKLGELSEDRQQAEVDLWERKVDEIRYRQQLIARMRNNFADVILYDKLAELDSQRVAMEEKRIRTIQEMVDVTGDRSIVYYTKAKMRHAESKNDYSRALQSQGLARRKLAKRAGISPDVTLIPEALQEVTQELDTILVIAYRNRPEIRYVQERIELANRQRRMETLKLIPWPTFVDVSYHREEKRREDWGEVMMGVNLPIFDLNIGNIRATRLAVTKKENEYDAIQESIEDEVRDAYIIYKDLLLDWNNFSSDADTLIADAESVIKEAKTHQTLLPDEVFEMEWTVLDTQKLLAQKRCDLAHALSDLYFAVGIERYEQLMTNKD